MRRSPLPDDSRLDDNANVPDDNGALAAADVQLYRVSQQKRSSMLLSAQNQDGCAKHTNGNISSAMLPNLQTNST